MQSAGIKTFAATRALLLDVTGTLMTFSEPVGVAYQAAVRQVSQSPLPTPEAFETAFKAAFRRQWKAHPCYGFGSGVSEEKWWKSAAEMTLATCLPGASLTPGARDAFLHEIYAYYGKPSAYSIYTDAWELLEFAKTKGMLVGILTNSSQRTIELLPQLDLQPYVHVATSCQSIGHAKPSLAAFDYSFHRLQTLDSSLRRDQVLHVGDDSEEDFKGATAAGLQAILLNRTNKGFTTEAAGKGSQVRNLCEVIEQIRGLR